MGWFWMDNKPRGRLTAVEDARHSVVEKTIVTVPVGLDKEESLRRKAQGREGISSPPACPMHEKSAAAMTPTAKLSAIQSSCPQSSSQADNISTSSREHPSRYSKYNPLNYMFSDISQDKAENQTVNLPLEREPSTIPKGAGDGNWEYPSPQQMYNALLRKGYHDTDATAVESMVSIHNFLNEGAWGEVMEWERRFGRGLARGWAISKRGEANALRMHDDNEADTQQTSLIRFQGRPNDMTPKATMLQVLGWIYPAGFKTEPPFDRHDWYVARHCNGQTREVRYVIDYYEGPDEPTGEPVFYLDVRPAMTPTAAVERMMRWCGDIWYRASGRSVKERKEEEE